MINDRRSGRGGLRGERGLLPAVMVLLLLLLQGCGVGLRKELPGAPAPPEEVAAQLGRLGDGLRTDKQIFRVRLLDKGRSFSGDGALYYKQPDSVQLQIYGPPFSTLWLQMLSLGDSLVVYLPREDRVVRSSRQEPGEVARLAGSEGLTDAVFLGGVTGVFDLERFRLPGMTETAAREGELSYLRLVLGELTYEFIYDSRQQAVVAFRHYQQGQKRREIVRSGFRQVEGLQRAGHVVYRDYLEDREITVDVAKEEVNDSLPAGAFALPEAVRER